MNRIAKIINNFITSVSIGDENYVLKADEMFLENALENGLTYAPIEENFSGFYIFPENYRLSDENNDENEFNKLITLCKLGIDSNILTNDSIIKIKDISGNVHETTVSRFFEIMVQYGLHCYNNRNY